MIILYTEEVCTQEDAEMLETYGEQVDFTYIGSLEPLVSYLKDLKLNKEPEHV